MGRVVVSSGVFLIILRFLQNGCGSMISAGLLFLAVSTALQSSSSSRHGPWNRKQTKTNKHFQSRGYYSAARQMASAIVQVGLSAVKDHTHTHARTQINNQISEFGRRLENRLAGPASQCLHTHTHSSVLNIFIDEALFSSLNCDAVWSRSR
jgi:hypothetical protein